MFSQRAYTDATRENGKVMERLATGKQINRASDDPAGMITVESLKASEKALTVERSNLDQVSKFLGAREGGLSAISDLLIDLKGSVQVLANKGGVGGGAGDPERKAYVLEAESIIKAINYAAATTFFGGSQIITDVDSGKIGAVTRTVTNADGTTSTRSFTLADLVGNGGISVANGDIEGAAASVEQAISDLALNRAAVGTYEQQISSQRSVISAKLENISGARSQIEDADFAKETANLVRTQVLQEASAYVQKVAAKQNADTALQLLKSAAQSL
jgi:flagellin